MAAREPRQGDMCNGFLLTTILSLGLNIVFFIQFIFLCIFLLGLLHILLLYLIRILCFYSFVLNISQTL